ncbi:MAG: DUF4105 domain-containing protein [Rhodanobacteraceae bacterium]
MRDPVKSKFHRAWTLLALLLCLLLPPLAHANISTAPGTDLQVDLYTYGPGTVYWERFGHDALVITDTADGESYTFNYGVFDFSQKHFYLNFARNYMIYRAMAFPTLEDDKQFVEAGRSITIERLNLTPEQRAQLRDFLIWNVQPQNSRYRYRYFLDNCTTRVRDALNMAMDGALEPQLSGPAPGGETYRSETDRLMSGQPWLMYLMDLGLGPFSDQPLTRWTGAFIPARLMQELHGVRATDGQPLVVSEALLSPQRLPSPPAAPPDLRWPLLGAGLVLGAAFVVSAWLRDAYLIERWWFAGVGGLYALLAGIAGALMLVVWYATAHRAGWANENLLLFNPLAWLLLPALAGVRGPGRTASMFAFAIALLMTLLSVFALVSKLSPWFPQHNLPWILFALPAWIGLACGVWLMRRHEASAFITLREVDALSDEP